MPTLAERVASFPYWYHRIELPGGVVTPGWAPLKPGMYEVPGDLNGQRVLDVGAWDGYWSFQALQRGAREVVAIDDFSDFLGSLPKDSRRAWDTFDLCREAFGYSPEQCRRIEMNVYDVSEQTVGRFDTIFFFGTLYHLRHPLLALDKLSAVCDGEIFIESGVCDDYSPYRGGLGHGYPDGDVVMEFYPDGQYGDNATNFWCPTLHCLARMTLSAGFKYVQAWKIQNPKLLEHCRGFVKGSKQAPPGVTPPA